MGLLQILTDTKKEAAENDGRLEHWRTLHDELKLEEIEYVRKLSLDVIVPLTCVK